LMTQVVNQEPQPVDEIDPQIPKALVHIVEKCLKKNANERYSTCLEVQADLEEYLLGRRVHVGAAQISVLVRHILSTGAFRDSAEHEATAVDLPSDPKVSTDGPVHVTNILAQADLPQPGKPRPANRKPTVNGRKTTKRRQPKSSARYALLMVSAAVLGAAAALMLRTVGSSDAPVPLAPEPVAEAAAVTTPTEPAVPEEVREPAAKALEPMGGLAIESNPKLDVRVDGVLHGTTPVSIDKLTSGIHDITLSAERHGIFKRMQIEIKQGVRNNLSVHVKKGALSLKTDPGVAVEVDGRLIGRAPISSLRLYEGQHSVKIKNKRGKSRVRQITVKPGEVTRLRLNFD